MLGKWLKKSDSLSSILLLALQAFQFNYQKYSLVFIPTQVTLVNISFSCDSQNCLVVVQVLKT